MSPEQIARQQIDAQFVACDWVVQDYKQFNPAAGRGIALREAPLKSAADIVADLEAALEQFGAIEEDLK